ncbi:helix-turn-helix domain-containing protein [Moraxella nasovis]|uniref:helix-turn-helix domain-containing protein n=1 Tax=Moraxella nasovis TaxID=2904121 RepID=UPI001F60E07D|nr:helix-turn-helix domain-containing protein [Moraxella nasovis]UNU74150.1 helix-turn-helix domain-containing protein [Moraxella nasovis]
MNKQFYTTREVCELMKISPRTLLRWQKEHLSGIKFPKPNKNFGRENRYKASEIMKWQNAIEAH